MPLDMYDLKPEGMVSYLRYNGYHFSKKMCEWAVSLMYKYDPSSKRDVSVSFWDKEKVDAVERSRSQIMEAVDLRPEVVRLAEGDQIREIPAGEAKAGDLVLVRPGDRVPLDGVVVSGESRIDTAPIKGTDASI